MVSLNEWKSVAQLQGGLIVSCQASQGEPLCAPEHILALALSALNGGATAIRLEGAANIKYVRQSKFFSPDIPIIGLTKSTSIAPADYLKKVYITGTFAEAKEIASAGCDIVALDATARPRPDGSVLEELIKRIHDELDKPVWADCATFAEASAAARYGADIVSTTLYGYTEETASAEELGPALGLLEDLLRELKTPVILEGRIWRPEELTSAFERGAYAVVVGSAITRPQLITERYVKAIPAHKVQKTMS